MAGSIAIPTLVAQAEADPPRHSALVRVTHWISAASFVGLVVSGIGIILAHPRFYWGENGGVGGPSLFDLPLPFMLGGPSGWGRSLHFQSAWVCVLNGIVYVAAGLANRHFRRNLSPAGLGLASLREAFARTDAFHYNAVQRASYLAVVFGLLPLMIWTGLAMSPAMTSLYPVLVTSVGGFQSARTIHFLAAIALVLFVAVHLAMVWRAGFVSRTRSMITGRVDGKETR